MTLKFDLTLAKETVEIFDGSQTVVYEVTEASAEAARQYRAARAAGLKVSGTKDERSFEVGEGSSSAESLLVSLCLWDEKENNVSLQLVRSWKDSVVNSLFKWIEKHSPTLLGEEEDKNEAQDLVGN